MVNQLHNIDHARSVMPMSIAHSSGSPSSSQFQTVVLFKHKRYYLRGKSQHTELDTEFALTAAEADDSRRLKARQRLM
jgi:hypothetical protein